MKRNAQLDCSLGSRYQNFARVSEIAVEVLTLKAEIADFTAADPLLSERLLVQAIALARKHGLYGRELYAKYQLYSTRWMHSRTSRDRSAYRRLVDRTDRALPPRLRSALAFCTADIEVAIGHRSARWSQQTRLQQYPPTRTRRFRPALWPPAPSCASAARMKPARKRPPPPTTRALADMRGSSHSRSGFPPSPIWRAAINDRRARRSKSRSTARAVFPVPTFSRKRRRCSRRSSRLRAGRGGQRPHRKEWPYRSSRWQSCRRVFQRCSCSREYAVSNNSHTRSTPYVRDD